jgi:hypothetical protein
MSSIFHLLHQTQYHCLLNVSASVFVVRDAEIVLSLLYLCYFRRSGTQAYVRHFEMPRPNNDDESDEDQECNLSVDAHVTNG